jgi:cysteine-rich repeat protein
MSLARVSGSGAGFAFLLVASSAAAQTSGEIVLMDGDLPAELGGASVTTVHNPRTNGAGEVSFVGLASDDSHYFWLGAGIGWLSSDELTAVLVLGSNLDVGWQGMSDAGAWVYEPDVDGVESIWTNAGVLVQTGGVAPGWATPSTFTLTRSSLMTPGGAIYFVSSVDTNGDLFGDSGAIYTTPDGSAASLAIAIGTGTTLGADTVSQVDDDYDVSDSGLHTIYEVIVPPSISTIAADGVAVMKEGQSVGGLAGDLWETFDLVSINDAGDYLVSGDTTGATETDEFIAYDGTIALRQADTVDGVTLPSQVLALSINDDGYAAHLWGALNTSQLDVAFYSCDAADLAASSRRLVGAGDTLDIDGDGAPDFTVLGLNADNQVGPGADLAEDMALYLEVDLDDGASMVARDAIVRFELDCCGNLVTDANEDCDDGGESAACNADCTVASCGDTVVNAAAGEDCDDGDESASCDDDCTLPECGDDNLNEEAGELCDDGNVVDGDGCSADCVPDGAGGMGGGGTGGAGANGGSGGSGNTGNTGNAGGDDGGAGGDDGPNSFQVIESDCGCRVPGRADSRWSAWYALLLLPLLRRKRR